MAIRTSSIANRYLSTRWVRHVAPGLAVACLACSDAADSPPRDIVADSLVLFEMDSATVAIRDVALAPDGSVWAISITPPFIHRYSADGRLVQRFGREGRGPGELRTPWAVMPTGNPERPVEVYELSARAIIVYDSAMNEVERRQIAGSPIMLASFETSTFGQMRWLERRDGGYLLFDQPMGVIASRAIQLSVLVRLDSAGAVIDTLADVRGDAPPVEVNTRPLELVDLPMAAACRDDGILLYDPRQSAILRFDRNGTPTGRDSLALPVRPLADEDIRAWLNGTLDMFAREASIGSPQGAEREEFITRYLREERDWFGETTPAATGLLCDTEGRAWLAEFSTVDDPTGRGRRWRVLDGSDHVTTIELPARFRPFLITRDVVLGVLTDDLDVQRVARVVLPPI